MLLLFVVLTFSSCSDEGCIEADDFGEYEQQILTVKANAADESCVYDPLKELIDAEQGSGLKYRLIKGHVEISNLDGGPLLKSDTGCQGFTDISIRNLCVEQAIQECLASKLSSPIGAEPMWMPTSEKQPGKNIGVTLTPGAEILIRAIGTVSLAGDKALPPIFVGSKKSGLQSFTDTDTSQIQDVRSGTTKTIRFSGMWRDGIDDDNSSLEDVGFISGSTDINSQLYSGARRLAIYVVSREGYGFDSSKNDEKDGVIGIPLFADTDLWSCSYKATSDLKESSCKSLDYNTNTGYGKGINSKLALETYGLISANQSKNLGKFGGLIRWDGDDLHSVNGGTDDPFQKCDTNCVAALNGKSHLGYIDATTQYTNDNPYPVELRARTSSGASTCEVTYTINGYDTTKDNSQNRTIIKDSAGTDDRKWAIGNDYWSDPIVLESGDVLNAVKNDCGKYTIVRIDKLHEITISNSGLVSFTTLGATASNCSVKGRIVNPSGNRNPFEVTVSGSKANFAADFYEYKTETDDPLKDLKVPHTPQINPNIPFSKNSYWSNPVFVRKGQKIRFLSSSWNNTFTTYAGSVRQCGIGMVMKIDERPAFLCRGKALDAISNPKCFPEVNNIDGKPTKCKEFAQECYDSKSESYCPDEKCQKNYETKCEVKPKITQNSCTKCQNQKQSNGTKKVTIEVNLPICYDLEGYEGSVANIDDVNGFSKDQLANSSIAKGAVKLGNFNGTYGNFENFIDTREKETTYKQKNIYQIRDPLTFSKSGRVKFLILDGNKFQDVEDSLSGAYVNNGIVGSKDESGYKITFSGQQEFVNGEMLEAILCLEDESGVRCSPDPLCYDKDRNIIQCKETPVPPQISGQPEVVRLKFNGISAESTTYYKFDDYGSLVRISNLSASNKFPEPVGIFYVGIGSNFYRHSYELLSEEDLKNLNRDYMSDEERKKLEEDPNYKFLKDENEDITKYSDEVLVDKYLDKLDDAAKKARNDRIAKIRLTFKIKDADKPDCVIDSGSKPPNPCPDCNGITIENKFYSASPVTSDAYCGKGEIPGSEANSCKKQYYCGNVYSNNSGSYQVSVRVKNKGSTISNMVNGVVTPVVEIMDGKNPDCNMANPNQPTSTISLKDRDGVKTPNIKYEEPEKNPSKPDQSSEEYQKKLAYYETWQGSGYDSALATYNTWIKDHRDKTCTPKEYKDGVCTKQFVCLDSKNDLNVGQAERVYKLLINDIRYKAILNITLILMVTFYGVGYLMGVSEFSQSEIIARVIKIGVIYLFVGPTGWYWFDSIFVKFFKNGTDYLAFVMATSFDRSPELKQAVDNYNFYDKSVLFSSVDKVFGMFFSSAVQKKVSALLFASIFGWAYLIIIYWGFMAYVYAVANAILLYLTSQVFISILFVLGPIFLITLLFNQTKEMFDKWLSQLISFSLQQIFLLTTLSFFNMMMYEVIKLSLGYRICWDDVWVINIITRIKLLSFWTVASMPPRLNSQTGVGNTGNATSIPSIFSIMFIWIVASLMQKFIEFMTSVAAGISDGIKASELASDVKAMGSKMSEFGGKAMGKLYEGKIPFTNTSMQDMVQRADRNLFDSGALASKERKERKEANKKNAIIKNSMAKSGDKAVRNFKEKNLNQLSRMTPAEQKEKLKEIYDKGVMEAGKKAGLTEEQTKALATNKGFKYEGSNVFGAAYQATKQAVTTGGALNKAVDERSVSRRISKDKIKAAMKNLDEKGRDEAMKSIKSGKIKLGENGLFKRIGKNIKENSGLYTLGVTSALKVVGVRENKEAYNKAKQQLLDEGRIDNLAIEAVRTDEEKKMIYKKMKDNKNASKVRTTMNTADKISYAQHFAEQAKKDQEEDKNKGEWGKLGNEVKRAFRSVKEAVQESKIVPKFIAKQPHQDKKDALKKDFRSIENEYQANLQEEMNETIANKAKSTSRMNKLIGVAEDIKKSPEMQTMAGLIDNHKNAVNKEEQRKAKDAMDSYALDSDYVERLEKWQEANTNAIYHKNEADVHADKEDKINKIEDELKKKQELREKDKSKDNKKDEPKV